jgi:3-hydroxy-3-methylglutaryl CoA synthase
MVVAKSRAKALNYVVDVVKSRAKALNYGMVVGKDSATRGASDFHKYSIFNSQ